MKKKLVIIAGAIVGLFAPWVSINIFGPLWSIILFVWIVGFAAAMWLENEHKKKVEFTEAFLHHAGAFANDLHISDIKVGIHPLLYMLLGFTGWGLVAYLGFKMAVAFTNADEFIHDNRDHLQVFELEPIHFDSARRQRLGNEPGMNTIILSSGTPFVALVAFRVIVPKFTRPLFTWLFGQIGAFHYYGFVQSSSPTDRNNGEMRHTAYVNTWFGESACRFEFLTTQCDVDVEQGVRLMDLRDTDGNYPPHGYQEHAGIYA